MVEKIITFRPDIKVNFMSAYTSNIGKQRGILEYLQMAKVLTV